ncbi:phosphatidate cytidylyltransferase [Limobrevibacterium gyesilva]|uniref:Phosphatidate cytidylyltransferase n=1 Tax=Limobrevibacterium gyesilva TaxID=2991712 RepID=A0AA41YMG9_9PROT|nr:phosphatidate cytidylyltransferase [Limobrevibacterium gyesilva]MCW3475226.1 phosphatidate cytidylyltransferase [Limobrevibacterium gyesilva]
MARVLADRKTPGGMRWGDLSKRVVSAAVLAPLALLCLWAGGWPWSVLIALATIGMAGEWRRMCRHRPATANAWWAPLLGLVYIVPGPAALLWLRADPVAGLGNVLFVILVVWATDIGAYLAGRLIGGAKLAPSISPGKTWSGAAGGVALALAVGLAAAHLDGAPLWRGLLVAAGLAVVAEAGDLLESALKRYFGVKDSGTLIPGHGGLLDRLDAVLVTAPAAALLAAMLGRGVELWR